MECIKRLSIVLLMAVTGCATGGSWRSAIPECREYANASCNTAMLKGRQSGVVICRLVGTTVRHAVTWVLKEDGAVEYWDNAFRCERTTKDFAEVFHVSEGLTTYPWCVLPLPAKDKEMASKIRKMLGK